MKPTEIHEQVADAYTEAVTAPGTCCCGGGNPKGVLAKVAGYGSEELATVPDNAVDNSFGCGNPLAFSDVKDGQVVLDLGSGAGIDVILAAQKVGPTGRVIGVDMTDAMIERGRANVETAGLTNVDLRKGLYHPRGETAVCSRWAALVESVSVLSFFKDESVPRMANHDHNRVLRGRGRTTTA